jgi:hypothetical protein
MWREAESAQTPSEPRRLLAALRCVECGRVSAEAHAGMRSQTSSTRIRTVPIASSASSGRSRRGAPHPRQRADAARRGAAPIDVEVEPVPASRRSVRKRAAYSRRAAHVSPRNRCKGHVSPFPAIALGTPWRFESSHPHLALEAAVSLLARSM